MRSNTSNLILIHQLCRFGVVGLFAALVHFCCVVFLVQWGTLNPLIANVFAFFVAFQFSYWGHRLWTFSDTDVVHFIALPKLLLIQCIVLMLSEVLFYLFLSLSLPYPIALAVVLMILPIFTFISNKFWVFK
ncbi:MAG: GtrA family protein [Gammaproteobacteria bacterium]|nr:GtrA family protein [Gammaproteobacteria bacterium]